MEQDRWVEESKGGSQKQFKIVILLGLIVAVIIGITILSCEKTKVKSLSFDKGLSTLKVGATDRLYVTIEPKDLQPELFWKSTNESVATVIDGVVTGKKAGEVTITATVIDQADISAGCKYIVEDVDVDIQTIDILEEPIVLRPGGHQQMHVSVTPENQNETILWSSSNESVARVNSRGKVEALKVGLAFIIATSDRTGVADTAAVSVEGAGSMPTLPTPGNDNEGLVTPSSPSKPLSPSKPAPTASVKQTPASKPAPNPSVKQTPASKPATASPTKPAQTTSAKAMSTKPVSSSGTKNFGYAIYKGKWPNDVRGRMEFKNSHVIDSKDPKGRIAATGDYVIGEWSEGHLVQGIWYGADNQVKGSILIGK